MNLPDVFKNNPESGQINFFQRKKDPKHELPNEEQSFLMHEYGIKKAPEGFKWKYLKEAHLLIRKPEIDLYKEGWELVPRAVIGINGEEAAGKTQLLFDLAVLYGVDVVENTKTGGQTLRIAGERRLRKKGFFRKKQQVEATNQASFVQRADEDDIALDNMQFGWVENPAEKPKLVDSRLIGLAIYYVRQRNPNIKAVSFYITASENARMKRLSERIGKPEEIVKAETKERRKLDIERYARLYKRTKRFEIFGDIINPHNTLYYDYIIDNTYFDREVALQTMHEHLVERGLVQKKSKPPESTEVYDQEKHDLLKLPESGDIFNANDPSKD